MNEAMESIYDEYRPPYIGLYLGVISGCLRTSSKKEPKGICLCKQATNVEDSSRTIVNYDGRKSLSALSAEARKFMQGCYPGQYLQPKRFSILVSANSYLIITA